MISIWFFIGVSLLVNGLLILGAGLYEHEPSACTPCRFVLAARLHLVGRNTFRDRIDLLRCVPAGQKRSVQGGSRLRCRC